MPTSSFQQEASRIVTGVRRIAMIREARYIASLENLILRVPGKDKERTLRDFGEDGKDGDFVGVPCPAKEILYGLESREILEGLQGRGAQDDLTL